MPEQNNTGEEVETFEDEDEDEEQSGEQASEQEQSEPEALQVPDGQSDEEAEDEDQAPEREVGVGEVELAQAQKVQEAAEETPHESIERLTGSGSEQAEYQEPFLAGGVGANAAFIQREDNAAKLRRELGHG